LAHYNELNWAEACGVPAHLLRVSVGLEEPEELWNRFQTALDQATVHSKSENAVNNRSFYGLNH
jgi:cystathionine gamma-synthase